jgi:hypothetical protein
MGEWKYSFTIPDIHTKWSGRLHALAILPPGKSPPPGTYSIGGWVGPRAGLDAVKYVWNFFYYLVTSQTLFEMFNANSQRCNTVLQMNWQV